MGEHLSLIAKILSDPTERTAKLVYADWLEEQDSVPIPCWMCMHGVKHKECNTELFNRQLRARFIRDTRIDLLHGYEMTRNHYRGIHEWLWFKRWPNCNTLWIREYSCGFVSRITCPISDWTTVADALTYREGVEPQVFFQPLEEVRLTGVWLGIINMVKTPALAAFGYALDKWTRPASWERMDAGRCAKYLFEAVWPHVRFTT